ncbi:hypothetical protein FRX31_009420 [Thalictrum thalictroides]|uniref:CCHC-type domain-containing protein n=1 Tax=Thalictrum thalictroides TaxID=46969 RepID=A0A7J6WVB5_THATH|nr:hypothetical protein FRX31_009420 [Thalictrum thalictroides]
MRIKGIADALAVTNTPIADSDLLLHTLSGLGVDYESFVTSIYTCPSPPTFTELHALLLNQEMRLEQLHLPDNEPAVTTAFFVQNNCGGDRGRGSPCGRNRGGRHNNGRGRYSGRRSHHFFAPAPQFQTPSILGAPPMAHTTCQICGRPGHSSLQCRQRYNQNQISDDIPQSFAAMALNSTPYDSHGYIFNAISGNSLLASNDLNCLL